MTFDQVRPYRLGLSNGKLLLPFFSDSGEIVGVKERKLSTPHEDKDRYQWGTPGRSPSLYFPPAYSAPDDKIFLCEGQLKSFAFSLVLGRPVLALSNGAAVGVPEKHPSLKDSNIHYLMDDDAEGKKTPALLVKQLKGHVKSLKAVAFPWSGYKYRGQEATDINDLLRILRECHGEGFTQALPGVAALIELLFLTSTDLLAPPEPEPSQEEEAEGPRHPYRVDEGRTVYLKRVKDGIVVEPLANFVATVETEVEVDDGSGETSRAFEIGGVLDSGQHLPSVRIPAPRFGPMAWVAESWGLAPCIMAGMGTKDKLREAIQHFSPHRNYRKIFTHTGWTIQNGEYTYLSHGGGIGKDHFEVDLPPELIRYCIPRVATDPKEAMQLSLALMGLAPLSVTIPLWAAVWRAILAHALPIDLTLWLEGITGSLKSTLGALFLCHFGNFDRTHLPGNWRTTSNALEKRAFLLKDCIFVVDDYFPSVLDARELEQVASRLIRSQGNLSGRSRLRSDLTERRTYTPRGFLISTGEQHPQGQSLLARMLIVEVVRQEIDLGKLTQAQAAAERLPHALSGFIHWLTPQMHTLAPALRVQFSQLRAKAQDQSHHLRVPEGVAHLYLGLAFGLTYAQEVGAISLSEVESRKAEGWRTLIELAETQAQAVEQEQPVRRFLEIIHALLIQKEGEILHKLSGVPIGKGPLLGWYDADYLYLSPEAAFQRVAAFARSGGEGFPIRQTRLRLDLQREGVLVTATVTATGEKATGREAGRLTSVIKVEGKSYRVLCLRIAQVEKIIGANVLEA
ncbi:MAG: hypothetical protein ACE1Z6_09890 [Candidatus Methylomirabilales bacterium]